MSNVRLGGAVFCGHLVADLDSIAGAIGAATLYNGVSTQIYTCILSYAQIYSDILRYTQMYSATLSYTQMTACGARL